MIKHTNPTCVHIGANGPESDCDLPTWSIERGGVTIRVNTPYCEHHARQWSDSRSRDLESSMGG